MPWELIRLSAEISQDTRSKFSKVEDSSNIGFSLRGRTVGEHQKLSWCLTWEPISNKDNCKIGLSKWHLLSQSAKLKWHIPKSFTALQHGSCKCPSIRVSIHTVVCYQHKFMSDDSNQNLETKIGYTLFIKHVNRLFITARTRCSNISALVFYCKWLIS